MLKLVRNTGIQIIYIAFFSLVYFPIIRGHYIFSDDYFWEGDFIPLALLSDRINEFGRPLDGLILYYTFDYVNSIDSANTVRLIGVIGVGLLAYVLYVIFKTHRFKTQDAFLMSILICTLPSIQVFVSWLVIISHVPSAVLSTISALLMFKCIFWENKVRTLYLAAGLLLAVILQIASLAIYQPSAMIYWTMALIPAAMLKDNDFRQGWYRPYLVYFLVGIFSMVIYYVLTKIMVFIMDIEFAQRGQLIGITGALGKLKWFFTDSLHYALNLWNIHLSYNVTTFVGLFVMAGFFCDILQRKKENKSMCSMNIFLKYIFIAGIILLSHSPNLLTVEKATPYRTLLALSAAICILLYFSLVKFRDYFEYFSGLSAIIKGKTITVLLLLLTITSTYLAYDNVNKYFAILQTAELKYVEDVIREYGISKLKETSKIYAINPEMFRVHGLTHEFGNPSSNTPWARAAMIKIMLNELGIKRNIPITHIDARSNMLKDDDALIVDFRKLRSVVEKRFE